MDKITITETTLVWGVACLTFMSIANTLALCWLARLAITGKSHLLRSKSVAKAARHQYQETRSSIVMPFGESATPKR